MKRTNNEAASASYRSMFHDMPRLTGGTDINQNQAVAYIAERLECDLSKAKSVFDQIRKPERKILVFDNITREWMGITVWQQSNTALNVARTTNRLTEENGKVLRAILRLLCEQAGKNYDDVFLNQEAEPDAEVPADSEDNPISQVQLPAITPPSEADADKFIEELRAEAAKWKTAIGS